MQGQTDELLKHRSLNKRMLEDMLKQTRNALIYSDLALFLLDSRSGINFSDVALYKWLNYHKLKLPRNEKKEQALSEKERYEQIIEVEKMFTRKMEDDTVLRDNPTEEAVEFDKKRFVQHQKMEEFRKSFKNIDEGLMCTEIKVPHILYLANKSEDGFEGDMLSEFYQMFPHSSQLSPLFISAEHGDGITDLYQAIKERIPES